MDRKKPPVSGDVADVVNATYANSPSVSLGPGMEVTGGEERPVTSEQRRLAEEAYNRGLLIQRDHMGASIRLPVDDDEAFRDDPLFAVDDTLLIKMAGSPPGPGKPEQSRYERAALLAAHGRLTPREVEHLSWLATASNPLEAVRDTAEALTQDQARDVMAKVEEREQRGRRGR